MQDEQFKELKKKLDPIHVKERQGMSYIEAWHAIAEANRIFGFDGWQRETVELIENHNPTKNKKDNFVVSFRARVRVTVGDIVREGTGFGNGFNADVHSAYELAIKEAETDAMKRALMTFGNQFGLALYDKKQSNVGVDEITMEGDEYKIHLDAIAGAKTTEELIEVKNKRVAAKHRMNEAQFNTLITATNKKAKLLKEITSDALSKPIETAVQ